MPNAMEAKLFLAWLFQMGHGLKISISQESHIISLLLVNLLYDFIVPICLISCYHHWSAILTVRAYMLNIILSVRTANSANFRIIIYKDKGGSRKLVWEGTWLGAPSGDKAPQVRCFTHISWWRYQTNSETWMENEVSHALKMVKHSEVLSVDAHYRYWVIHDV